METLFFFFNIHFFLVSSGLIIFCVGLDVVSYATITVYDHPKHESHETLGVGAFYPGLVMMLVSFYGYYAIWYRQELIQDETKRIQTLRNLFYLHIVCGILAVVGIVIDGVVGYGQEDLGHMEICANDDMKIWTHNRWGFGVDDKEQIYVDCLLPRNTADCYCSHAGKCWEYQATSTQAFYSSDCSVFLNEHEYPSSLATTFSFCILLILLLFLVVPCSVHSFKPNEQTEALVATSAPISSPYMAQPIPVSYPVAPPVVVGVVVAKTSL